MTAAPSATPKRSRYLPWLVLTVVLSILAAAIVLTSVHLRRAMRSQIIQQDGIGLYAGTLVQDSLLEGLDPEIAADPELRFADMANQMFETAWRRGAFALRIFDENGELHESLPVPGLPRHLSNEELAALAKRRPVSSFEPNVEFSDFTLESGSGPVVRVLVPLIAEEHVLGSAEFVIDGQNVAAALSGLDHDLWRYAVITFLIGGGLISASLGWAFRKLNRTNELLLDRTQSLLRANHELTLAAKTSAVGAIASHLIHDLKNPLFGLQSFVSLRGSVDDEDWAMAADTTERMQTLISEIVRILKEEKTAEHYELTTSELFELLRSKLKDDAEKSGIELVFGGECSGNMANRDANVIILVITNLVHNAIQSTPRGGRIAVKVSKQPEAVVFEISDTGPGLPSHIVSTLFTPSRSTKTQGTGLGLAISKQLANHIGADLCLKNSSKEGTTFELRVPQRAFTSELVLS